jgi:xanthine dehydrogenase YagS FAD-binding subunit
MDGSHVQQARVALGAVAHTPRRALQTEEWLTGRVLDEGTLRNAARLSLAQATPLERNAYKLPLLEVEVRRTIEAAAKEEP